MARPSGDATPASGMQDAGLEHDPVAVDPASHRCQAAERGLDLVQLGIGRDLRHETPNRSLKVDRPRE